MHGILLVARSDDEHLDAVTLHLPEDTHRAITHASEFLEIVRKDVTRGLCLSLPALPTGLAQVEHDAWAALRTAVLSDTRLGWVSRLSDMFAAANRITQMVAASALGIDVPDWVVPGSVDDLRRRLGDGPYVLKPLGPGQVRDPDGARRELLSTPMEAADLADESLTDVPVLAQEWIGAARHVRVVTVGRRVFGGSLPAEEGTVDWRALEEPTWEPMAVPATLSAQATTLASHLGLGHSSQDWLESRDGRMVFLRLHPQADWMFLPEETRLAIGGHLAHELVSSG